MGESRAVEVVRAARRELMEEEKRLGREEFRRRQHERVAKFLDGSLAEYVSPRRAPRKAR